MKRKNTLCAENVTKDLYFSTSAVYCIFACKRSTTAQEWILCIEPIPVVVHLVVVELQRFCCAWNSVTSHMLS